MTRKKEFRESLDQNIGVLEDCFEDLSSLIQVKDGLETVKGHKIGDNTVLSDKKSLGYKILLSKYSEDLNIESLVVDRDKGSEEELVNYFEDIEESGYVVIEDRISEDLFNEKIGDFDSHFEVTEKGLVYLTSLAEQLNEIEESY